MRLCPTAATANKITRWCLLLLFLSTCVLYVTLECVEQRTEDPPTTVNFERVRKQQEQDLTVLREKETKSSQGSYLRKHKKPENRVFQGAFGCHRQNSLAFDVDSQTPNTPDVHVTYVELDIPITDSVGVGEYKYFAACICTPDITERIIRVAISVKPYQGKARKLCKFESTLVTLPFILKNGNAGDPNLYVSFSNTLPTITTSEFISAWGSSNIMSGALDEELLELYSDQKEWQSAISRRNNCKAKTSGEQTILGTQTTVFFSVRGSTQAGFTLKVTGEDTNTNSMS